MHKSIIFLLSISLITTAASAAPARAHYELKQKFTLGGEGFWDYLTYDPAGKRLFISHGTHVVVV
ncbi:MAG: YncE family protein, partial [Actinomycetota bacterium]